MVSFVLRRARVGVTGVPSGVAGYRSWIAVRFMRAIARNGAVFQECMA
jgi:hypothetical protein